MPRRDPDGHRAEGYGPAFGQRMLDAISCGLTVVDRECRPIAVSGAAAGRGVGLATVRTHPRALRQKTGTDRQATLMRLLATLAIVGDMR